MQNTEQNNNSDFMIERIKQRPLNKRKLFRRTMITLSMAVIFGLVACVTFLLLEPVISNWLYPPQKPPVVTLPEDKEEMRPEEMLSESEEVHATPKPAYVSTPEEESLSEQFVLTEEQIIKLQKQMSFDAEHYAQLYTALNSVVKELDKQMVTVTARKTNVDWLSNIYESSTVTMGVVIKNSEGELLILTDYNSIREGDTLQAVFHNGIGVQAVLKRKHTVSDLAILSIDTGALNGLLEDIPVVEMGNTYVSNLCRPVIAMGCPMGESGSVGYGMITSEKGQMTMVDANYKVLKTDIYGSTKATGFLFSLEGKLLGIITGKASSSDMANMISAYGISDLRKLIHSLTEGKSVAYMGITGIDVSVAANTEGQVPLGVYVTNLNMNSPAMLAGVQRGDIVVELDGRDVGCYNDYFAILNDLQSNQTVKLKIMRQMQSGYTEIEFNITLEEAK